MCWSVENGRNGMPLVNGVSFLKSLTSPPRVIFTTAYADYALQGYELDVVDYLLKPFSYERWLRAVEKVKYMKVVAPGRTFLVHLTMKKLEELLPPALFVRVHKSYIVSLGKIRVVRAGELVLMGEVVIPVSGGYREEVVRMYGG